MNRFELEEAITKLWQTSDDLNLLCGSLSEDEDGILNKLTGISEMHDLRVQRVWDIFENLINEGIITNGGVENTLECDRL